MKEQTNELRHKNGFVGITAFAFGVVMAVTTSEQCQCNWHTEIELNRVRC